ncbi:MAG TPA: hypothetical protein DIT93_12875 [Pelagibacterium sp.]|uniref:hypothetical protein n=1 Tax=uncultured Pelagibacterium sp. TaxID=1159875 RepID=UPI000EDE6478|nr:hypothetical protein [Pelagibacterium sp.]|tara:strand:+ start:819 stop:1157 length:339 start_codon:yes stop_codon:yes gene_type:complete
MFRPFLAFQTRAPDRDRQTDLGRRQAVLGVLGRQTTEIEREIAGLQRRMDEAYQRAATVLANSDEYGERSKADEEEISRFEASAEAARRRIVELEAQLELFSGLQAALKPDA